MPDSILSSRVENFEDKNGSSGGLRYWAYLEDANVGGGLPLLLPSTVECLFYEWIAFQAIKIKLISNLMLNHEFCFAEYDAIR